MKANSSLSVPLYGLRCRLGAWLLREHVAALLERYDAVSDLHHAKADPREIRTTYIMIGLKHAVRPPWRRFTWPEIRLVREAADTMQHARDAL